MLFNTAQFFAFLAVVLLLFYALPRSFRTVLLVIASYFFYMSWNPKFIALLLALTAIDYTAGLWIARSEGRRRKVFLIASLVANLGFLGFFKYFNFLADNLARLIGRPHDAFALSIVLPLGISFHTFQSMSYVVDVYRKEQEPIRNPLEYALFISFFPQLVAGPIVRAREFFKDLYHWRRPNNEEVLRGVLLIAIGLAKKVAFADQFARIADAYFKNPAAQAGGWTARTAVAAFALQIFFDFSGYTDMAIGMAALFGFHFPENFRRPYLAASITDFWRRWHMSLSRWLRDYLYISLGGNRHGKLKTYRNLMLTMLLGGLWHGASWNFVIWGGYHGALLSIERMFGRDRETSRGFRWFYPIGMLVTFVLVCIGWIFFRAATFSDSMYVLGQFLSAHGGVRLIPGWLIYWTAIAFVAAIVQERTGWMERLARGPAWAYVALIVILLFAVELIGVTDNPIPFVYFQF
jgi:D-alanyl-lipoteichoic acid acyltransferase DltB (MBOAT superfamily)